MITKPNISRASLRIALALAALCSAVVTIPERAAAQQTYYTGRYAINQQPTRYVPQPARIVYYRGADGRLYGVSVPPAVAAITRPLSVNAPLDLPSSSETPQFPRLAGQSAPLRAPASSILIEDAAVRRTESPAPPKRPITIDTSARAEAEAALERFSALQNGTTPPAAPARGSDRAAVAQAEQKPLPAAPPEKTDSAPGPETASAQPLPPPKVY